MVATPDIIFLVLDTLRADYCSCLGESPADTPELDAIAASGCTYTNVRSTATWTVPAMASVFTGELPSAVGTYAGREHLDVPTEQTLASRVAAAGYDTLGVTANPWLTAEFGFDAGFDEMRSVRGEMPYPDAGDPHGQDWPERWRDKLPQALRWASEGDVRKRIANLLAQRRMDGAYADATVVNQELASTVTTLDGATFLFANYMDAHEPYVDTGRPGSNVDYPLSVNWNLHSLLDPPENEPTEIRTAYRESIEFLDEQLGVLFETLRDAGRFEDAFVVVTSDHGQALGEHGFWGHGSFLLESIIHVPLLIRPPASWDDDDVPDTVDTQLSLRWVYDLLTSVANADRASDVTFDPPRDSRRPVVVESNGAPQDVDIELPDDQSTRSRGFYFEDGRVVRLRDPDRELLWIGEMDTDGGMLLESARAEDATLPSLGKKGDESTRKMGAETKQQLQNLGYM